MPETNEGRPQNKKLDRMLDQIRAGEIAKDVYRPFWLLNQMYYDGIHDEMWDRKKGRFTNLRDDDEDWRATVKVNLFRLITDTITAKLTQNRPVSETEPVHSDLRSVMKARAASKISDYVWDSMVLREKLYDVTKFAVLHGAGWWGVYWNPDAGEDLGDGEKAGAGVIHALSNFDVGFDPMARDVNEALYAYRIHFLSVGTIKKLTGANVPEDMDADSSDRLTPGRAMSTEIQDKEIADKLGTGYAPVWEFYDLAAKKMYWLSRDRILREHNWTLGNPFIPFYYSRASGRVDGEYMVAGNIYGSTHMHDVREVNFELNSVLSHVKDIRRLTASPRYFMPRRQKPDVNTLSTKPGHFIELQEGATPPVKIDGSEVPSYVQNLITSLSDYCFRVAGVNEVTEGRGVGSMQSARGAGVLAELDAGRFNPVAANISKAINTALLTILRMWHEFSPDETLAALVGPNAGMDLATWTHDEVNLFNIRIREGSTFAKSKAMRRQDILEAVQLGIFTSPSAVKKAMEFDDIEEVEGDNNAQRLLQRRELERMILEGQEVQPNPFDDHEIHADETKTVLLSPDYETFDPALKQRLLNHWLYHTQQMAQQMAAIQGNAAGMPAPQGGSPGQVSMHKGVPQGEGAAIQ